MSNFMVGRQPVFDAQFKVQGYELLFRCTDERPGGDAMTADVLVHAGLDIGLEDLVGKKLAFVNATRSFLVGDHELPFPPEQTVVEVLEDVPRDTEVFEGCRRLADAGYTLALDDYVCGDAHDPLLQFVSIIKLDILALSPAEIERTLRICSAWGVKRLAEKVETHEQVRACQAMGFDLYQGYVLSRPEVVGGNSLTPGRFTCLRIIEKLCDPRTSARDIERLVQTDAALSYRFLRAAGVGAAGGLYRKVNSVREGVVLLGHRRLRSWVMLMLLSDAREGSDEQLRIAMTRARMAELMATALRPRLTDRAFTVGLVSALDLLLQVPLEQILDGLSLSRELVDALISHGGTLGRIIEDVLAWEFGGGELQLKAGLDLAGMEKAYIEALLWANEVCGVLDLA
jgi:EAL and modified HD-GYP domain-containing signal transduction protein